MAGARVRGPDREEPLRRRGCSRRNREKERVPAERFCRGSCFDKRSPSCVDLLCQYFFENVERTVNPDFVPSDDDILRCRVKTTGISETVLKVGDLKYRLLDVGGQRTERRKWLNCFGEPVALSEPRHALTSIPEDVTVLLFLVAIQEFDQSLYEDESVNRLQESVTLFESVANSRYFANSSIILFLNKIDLFAAKLKSGTKLVDFCPDYAGANEFEPAYAL